MQYDDMVIKHVVDQALTAILEHHQGVHHDRMQAGNLYQKLVNGNDFADGLTSLDQPIEMTVITHA
jgi:hypothetical protein